MASVNMPRDAGSADWYAQALIQSSGGTFVYPDGTPGFDTPEGRRALSIWENLGAEGLQDPISAADAFTAFTSGRLAYYTGSPAQSASAQKAVGDAFEWTVTDLPIPDGGKSSLSVGGNDFIVLSDDACRAAFANEMISDLLDPEIIAASSKTYSYIPVDTEAATQLATDPAATTQLGYSWTYTGTPTPWGGWHGAATPRVNALLKAMAERLTTGEDTNTVVPETVRRITSAVK
ncbi:hypothetical protein MLGJGCBP_06748 [Rhodococcus sp. T7]|nr:hypothetical protein MLGJGCBP_09842 [Rhodococcus sp. T7]KAF0960169.1 hypothetical protein MLGJGCBP_06748 [Rhodococcus sp. T7]